MQLVTFSSFDCNCLHFSSCDLLLPLSSPSIKWWFFYKECFPWHLFYTKFAGGRFWFGSDIHYWEYNCDGFPSWRYKFRPIWICWGNNLTWFMFEIQWAKFGCIIFNVPTKTCDAGFLSKSYGRSHQLSWNYSQGEKRLSNLKA